ncbi:ABC transporter ATP-binding protein [Crateriforma conspicua]|uniref:ABC transporter ATP-binding protein n=1 Tax=Crateriforma conspicua TaxID=2527996 RepID=UPI00118B5498|nr:ABC transporter ATP-binding protein [Crateriforma conspicua]QDV64899.1 putative ABC transporter ATP-binding protein YxlF [Crateriforma conspicua]
MTATTPGDGTAVPRFDTESQSDAPGLASDAVRASEAAIVRVTNLQKSYRGGSVMRRTPVKALRGVTLQAYAGEVFGLLGPNGAGKTTLIKTLLGIIQPSGGTAELFGIPVHSFSARRRVGYLPESLRIDRHHTARTALWYYGRLSGMTRAQIQQRRESLLKLVGLENRSRESVRRFSKGMYQRLGLAQALMHNPDLLILDEPTDGLDPVGRNEVRRVIERLRDDGKTIFLNSHILQEVELVCSRVAIMAGGEVKGIGTIDELRGDADGSHVSLHLRVSLADYQDGPETPTHNTDFAAVCQRLNDSLGQAGFNTQNVAPEKDDAVCRLAVLVDRNEGSNALVDWLRSRDIRLLELTTHRPSLEDTFLRLVGRVDTQD